MLTRKPIIRSSSGKLPAGAGSSVDAPAKAAAATRPAKASSPKAKVTRAQSPKPPAAAGKTSKPTKGEERPGLDKRAKPEKAQKKPPKVRARLVRDGFTMPETDFALIATLKSRALEARREAKKSELLRAGLRALAALDSKALVATLNKLEPVKIGRPKQGH